MSGQPDCGGRPLRANLVRRFHGEACLDLKETFLIAGRTEVMHVVAIVLLQERSDLINLSYRNAWCHLRRTAPCYRRELNLRAGLRMKPANSIPSPVRRNTAISVDPKAKGRAELGLTVHDGRRTLPAATREEKTMNHSDQWRPMASAPKDGSRILVTVRPSEQGPADVDLAYWSHGDRFGVEGWRAADSSPGCVIEYAEPELKCWMPMPAANLGRASMPSPWEGNDAPQFGGSGI